MALVEEILPNRQIISDLAPYVHVGIVALWVVGAASLFREIISLSLQAALGLEYRESNELTTGMQASVYLTGVRKEPKNGKESTGHNFDTDSIARGILYVI